MKYLYRISLTFMILTILSATVLGGYYLYQHEKQKFQDEGTKSVEPAEETASNPAATDCDTEYVVLEENLNTGESASFVQEIPAKYIGKNKEELTALLSQEEKSPSLRDRQKGIKTIRLSAFSHERVVVVKTYEIEEEAVEETVRYGQAQVSGNEIRETIQSDTGTIGSQADEELGGYYLMANDGHVCVYYEDMQTMYLTTGIALDRLPDEVRQEVLDKKYIKNEEELYNFLESYSS